MNENELQDLDVSVDEAANVTGGMATPQPVTPVAPGLETTIGKDKKTVINAITPLHPGPTQ